MNLRSPRGPLFLTRVAWWLACLLVLAGGSPAYGQDLRLRFHGGLVDLRAHAVTVAAILERWSQMGGTTVVNGDQIQSGPMTIDLVDAPEREALSVILRGVPGYLLADGADPNPARSVIGRIVVLATRTTLPTATPVVPASAPAVAVSPSRLMPSMLPEPDEPNRDGLVIIGRAPNEAAGNATAGSLQGATQVPSRPGFVASSGLAGMSRAVTASPVSGRAGETTLPSTPPAYVPNSQPAYVPNSQPGDSPSPPPDGPDGQP